MKKAHIVVLSEDKSALLESLQRYGELMLIASEDVQNNIDASTEDALMQRAEKSISLVKKYAKKKGFGEQFVVEYDTFASHSPEHEQLLSTIEKTSEEIVLLHQENGTLSEKMNYYFPWIALDTPLDMIYSSKYANIKTGFVESRNIDDFKTAVESAGGVIEIIGKLDYENSVLLAYVDEDEAELMEKVKTIGFNEIHLTSSPKTVSEIVSKYELSYTNNVSQILTLEQILKDCSLRMAELQLLFDQAASASNRKKAIVQDTLDTTYFVGWVRSDRLDRLEKSIQNITDIYDLEITDPVPGEMPPTATKNNRFVDAFETITDMFAKPNAYEVDPNPIMSFWYWLIFGMMMGDAGYGVVMIVLVGFLIKKMKPKGNALRLFRVIFYGGFSTILWGILFGSYFGYTWMPIILEPMNDPLEMLILSIVIGTAHIITGLLVKAYHNLRDKNYFSILSDSFSWIFILLGIGMLFLPGFQVVGKWLAISGAGIIVLFAGRAQKSIPGRLGLGLYTLYGASSYLGDILSYSRILALSMSSAVLAMVMNMLAGMLANSIIGLFFGIIVFLIGHMFNLAMGLLSAYVHASRLQYIDVSRS
jgi:V/A-type H+-transporting ATPase subunit I